MTDVLSRLASALFRSDERPNVALAEDIAARSDKAAIAELVEALSTRPIPIQNDAIKTLYEIGERRPALIAPHLDAFLALLASKNNRNIWGALQAIETIAGLRRDDVSAALRLILTAADKSSVIAKDKAIGILVRLAGAGHADQAMPLLLDRLVDALPNQFVTYAEEIGTVVDRSSRSSLIGIIQQRRPDIEGATRQARLEKLMRKLQRTVIDT